jgi:hypothetical protein
MEINPIILAILVAAVIAVVVVHYYNTEPIDLGVLLASFTLIILMISVIIEEYNDTLELTFYERSMLMLIMAFLYLYMTSLIQTYTLKFKVTK